MVQQVVILSVDGNVNFLLVEFVLVLPIEQHLVLSRNPLRQRQTDQPDVPVAAESENALEPIGLGAHDEMLSSARVGQTVPKSELGPFEESGFSLPMGLGKAPRHRQLVPANDIDQQSVFLLQREVVDVDEALSEVLGTHGEEAQVGHDGPQNVAEVQRNHFLQLPIHLLFGPPEGGCDQIRLAVQVQAVLVADGRQS